jgi:peroxiredoxin
MEKRAFLQTFAAGVLGLALPPAFSAERKEKRPKAYAAPADGYALAGHDSADREVNLGDFAGKTVLVSFFTFECVHCDEDLRLMREFFAANKARNFTMLGVNMDKHKQAFLDYMRLVDQAIPADRHFPIVWRNAPGHSDTFGTISTMPTHFVLDKNHKEVLRRDGQFKSTDWDDLWTNLS